VLAQLSLKSSRPLSRRRTASRYRRLSFSNKLRDNNQQLHLHRLRRQLRRPLKRQHHPQKPDLPKHHQQCLRPLNLRASQPWLRQCPNRRPNPLNRLQRVQVQWYVLLCSKGSHADTIHRLLLQLPQEPSLRLLKEANPLHRVLPKGPPSQLKRPPSQPVPMLLLLLRPCPSPSWLEARQHLEFKPQLSHRLQLLLLLTLRS
jgi:hypothetical protein